jgi:aspartate beta-hydroxylase
VNQPRPGQKPDAAWQIQLLADSAAELANRGELQDAERVYRQILDIAPYHVRALNFLAGQTLSRGELDDAQALLERALRAAPERPVLHQNMGLLQKQRGNLEAALGWLDKAIALKPDHEFASLHRGALLLELGRRDEAMAAYRQAWKHLPNAEATANSPLTPPALRDLIMEATLQLRGAQLELIHAELAPVLDEHGKDALRRVIDAADIYVGQRAPRHRHGLQRPSYIYLPDLEPQAFFDRSRFDWLPRLESATAIIREELQAALAADQGLAPYVQVEAGTDPQQWSTLNGSRAWSALHLTKGGTPVEENRARCPKTTRVVDSLPLPQIPGHAPEALFSILQPGTYIPPHFGLANYKLVAHLPLMVPPDCAIRVGNETRGWTEGECLVFDDSFQHEAWNRSDKQRAVLILDIWHPDVTLAEQAGIGALVRGIAAFNRRYAPAG